MIKPENDRKTEYVTWLIFPFAATEVSIVNKIGRIICQYEGVLEGGKNCNKPLCSNLHMNNQVSNTGSDELPVFFHIKNKLTLIQAVHE